MKDKSRFVLIIFMIALIGMGTVNYLTDRQHDIDRSVMYQVFSVKVMVNETQDQLEYALEYWEEIQDGTTLDRRVVLTEKVQMILENEASKMLDMSFSTSKIDLLNPLISIELVSFEKYLDDLRQSFEKKKILTESDVENLNRIIEVGIYMGTQEFYVEQNLFNSVPNEYYLEGYKKLSEITYDMTVGEGDYKPISIVEIADETERMSDLEISTLTKVIVAYLNNVPVEIDRKYEMRMHVLSEFLYEYVDQMDDHTVKELLQVDQHLDGAGAETYAATLLKLFYGNPKRFISIATTIDSEKRSSIYSFIAYSGNYSKETCMQVLSEIETSDELNEEELIFLQGLKESVVNFEY